MDTKQNNPGEEVAQRCSLAAPPPVDPTLEAKGFEFGEKELQR